MNNDISYTQCYWHANGNLTCKKVTIPYDSNKSNSNLQFNSFSCPNSNYKPNEYRNNLDYYQQPHSNMCGQNCDCTNTPLPNQWFSPPRTQKRQQYLQN